MIIIIIIEETFSNFAAKIKMGIWIKHKCVLIGLEPSLVPIPKLSLHQDPQSSDKMILIIHFVTRVSNHMLLRLKGKFAYIVTLFISFL